MKESDIINAITFIHNTQSNLLQYIKNKMHDGGTFSRASMTLERLVKAQITTRSQAFRKRERGALAAEPDQRLKNICQRNRELVYRSCFDDNELSISLITIRNCCWRRALALNHRKDGQYHGEDQGVYGRLKLLTIICVDILNRIEAEMARTQSMYLNPEDVMGLG